MKLYIVCDAFNSMPFVREIETDDLLTASADINKIESSFIPRFAYSPEAEKFYRIVSFDDQTFLSDDAYELLGPATPPEEFKRIGD